MSIWRLAYSALARAASASARARAAARLAAELFDRREAADLHSDLTSSCESCEVSSWLDMVAVAGVECLRILAVHLMRGQSFYSSALS